MDELRIFSFGGGVQSTAVMVLQATGRITPYDAFVFANVGHDSENPATLEYIETVTKPYAATHDIALVEVALEIRGKPVTLLEYLQTRKRSIPIPVRVEGKMPFKRICTNDWKIRQIDKWIRQQHVTRATVGLGISVDEFQRARDTDYHDNFMGRPLGFLKRREYPLVDARISRQDCLNIIRDADLSPPPRSACWFCPLSSRARWMEQKQNEPEMFQKAIDLEQHLNHTVSKLGREPVYLHVDLRPLENAVPDQMPLFSDDEQDNCDSGYCFV